MREKSRSKYLAVRGFLFLIATGLVLAGRSGPAARRGDGAEDKCRRVKLTGTIKIVPLPKPGFRGTADASEGKFTMDLIFAEKGGEILYQQNTVELTALRSFSFGGARDCVNTLPENARTPRPFKIWAKLVPEGVVVTDEATKKEKFGDQFDLMLKEMPAFPPFTFTAQCTGGKPGPVSDYGMSCKQLLQPFAATQYGGTLWLNKFGATGSLGEVNLFGAMKAIVEWEVLETLVPCKNFQYK